MGITEELSLISRQEPGIVALDNFEELKLALQSYLEGYKTIVYTPENIKDAKEDKKALSKLKKSIEDKRKEIKKIYMMPYEIVEAQAKELVALIDEPLKLIADFICGEEDAEKEIKKKEISLFYESHSQTLGDLAETVFSNPCFYDKKWENKTTTVKTYQNEIAEKVSKVSKDIETIKASGGKFTGSLIDKYLENLSMDGLAEYKSSLISKESAVSTTSYVQDEDDKVIGYKVLKLSGTQGQLMQIMEQMELLGIEVDELEDGMPKEMQELTELRFDSFVAFDIETTGTFGAANNDAPPEITEIGAVKVVNGEIVDRFSELANPGRKIVPHIARLTNITDEMVADKPPVSEVIKKFKEFVGDSILVGHNIKNCDIPYISKAAKKAGIAFDNRFLDTYRYAKTIKDKHGWENVKLETLSEIFAIEQKDAHRAWCDAEANVGVYFKLKEL